MGAAFVAALVLAGCGSGEKTRAAPRPKLPDAIAGQLADTSDQVAAALGQGDTCRALAEARRLQEDLISAVNDGRIPAAFQEHLGTSVNDLRSRITCVQPPADEDEEHGKGKDKGKGEKENGKEGDD